MAERTDPALVVRGVTKTFGALRALDDISLTFPKGTVTALLGENGSGKSTLVKILAGVYEPDPTDATVQVGDTEVGLPLSPARAHHLGLRFLHQSFGLVEEATVIDNIAFASGFLSRGLRRVKGAEEHQRARSLLERFEIAAAPEDYVGDLSPVEQVMVAIARVFGDVGTAGGGSVVVLDEPTAALPVTQVDRVFRAIRRAHDEGTAIVLVSHRLEEVERIADQVAVVRDGRRIAERPITGLAVADLVELMIGHSLAGHAATPAAVTEVADTATSARPLVRATNLRGGRLRGATLEIRAGEVLGLAGLVGSGSSELISILGGARRPASGLIEVDGVSRSYRAVSEAIVDGIVTVPQNRRRDGVILDFTVRENLTLGNLGPVTRRWSISPAAERKETEALIERFDIRPSDPEVNTRFLSGGNQQKVAIARALRLGPRVLLLDEPTQGIDIGARDEIGRMLSRLAEEGVAVVIATSDNDDLLEVADRVLVLNRGIVQEELRGEEISRDRLAWALTTGGRERSA